MLALSNHALRSMQNQFLVSPRNNIGLEFIALTIIEWRL